MLKKSLLAAISLSMAAAFVAQAAPVTTGADAKSVPVQFELHVTLAEKGQVNRLAVLRHVDTKAPSVLQWTENVPFVSRMTDGEEPTLSTVDTGWQFTFSSDYDPNDPQGIQYTAAHTALLSKTPLIIDGVPTIDLVETASQTWAGVVNNQAPAIICVDASSKTGQSFFPDQATQSDADAPCETRLEIRSVAL